jgi:crotonobetainyl-CoA hydratase
MIQTPIRTERRAAVFELALDRPRADAPAADPSLVLAAIEEITRESRAMRFQDALNRVTRSQFETVERLHRSGDRKDGARGFAERRGPVRTGR